MKWALLTCLAVDGTSYDDADAVLALKHAGVKGFNSHILGLSVLDIDDLYVPADATKGTPDNIRRFCHVHRDKNDPDQSGITNLRS